MASTHRSVPGSCCKMASTADASSTRLLTFRVYFAFPDELRSERTALGYVLADDVPSSRQRLARGRDMDLLTLKAHENGRPAFQPQLPAIGCGNHEAASLSDDGAC